MSTEKTGLDKVLEQKDYDLIIDALEIYESHLSIKAEEELGNEGKSMLIAMKRANLGRLKALMLYGKEYNK